MSSIFCFKMSPYTAALPPLKCPRTKELTQHKGDYFSFQTPNRKTGHKVRFVHIHCWFIHWHLTLSCVSPLYKGALASPGTCTGWSSDHLSASRIQILTKYLFSQTLTPKTGHQSTVSGSEILTH